MGQLCSIEKKSDINPNYDTFIKSTEKKDGLDLYKTKEYIYSEYQIRCPIIKDKLNDLERIQIENQINNADKNIRELFDKYNTTISDVYEIDIFGLLESLNNEIELGKKKLEQNRYFLHTCKLQQQIYLDISTYNNDYDFNNLINDKRYIYDNWKNNLNVKNNLLEERRINYLKRKEEDELERKKREIKEKKENEKKRLEEKYRKEFDDYCIEKERSILEMAKMNINMKANSLDLVNMDINAKRFNADYLYDTNVSLLNYKINRKKLKEYIKDIFGCTPNDNRFDSNESIEKNEFKFYISSREGNPQLNEILNDSF